MATITVHAGGSIQTAINSAANGDTIFIENGTYLGQISIAGRTGLTLQGESDTGVIIKTPVSLLAQNATDATTGRSQDAIISVSSSTNITIENLKVDGADRGNDVAGGNDFVGIAVANSTGTIHDVDVSGIRDALVGGEVSGNQRGNAIVISNAGSPLAFTVSDSSVENYQKTAIIARNTTITLTNNDIDGGGPHTGIAQNGIQLSSGSTGSVTGNHISGIGYTGANEVVGLFVFDSHGTVTVSGNTFDGTTANDIFAYVSSSTGVTVSGNTINNSDQGVVDTDTITTPNDITNNTYNNVDNPYSFDPFPTTQTTPYNVHGTPGDDYLRGGAGNDHIDGAGGSDTVDMSAAGAGGAFVNLTSGIAVSGATGIDTLVSIENVIGSAGNDQLIGNGSDNTFFASGGSDTIDGRGGSDTFDASSATGSVVIDLDSGFVGGAFSATLTSIENAVGGSGADFIAGGTGANILTGNGGDDSFLNLHDGDVVHGGSGLDTAAFTGNLAGAAIAAGPNGTITVTQAGETVTLDKVETLQFADHNVLVVGAGGDYATIQSAINASHTGDTILVAAGTYNENVTVNVDGLTIKAIGDATVHGTFKSSNGGIADGGVAAFLESGASYVQTAGKGFTISADNVTLDGLHIDGFNYGVELSDGTDGATLKNIAVTDSLVGIRKGTTAGITNLTISGGSISDGLIGIDFDKTTTAGAGAVGTADHVTIDGTSFSHLAYKGIYVEALSNAHITNVTMNDVAQFGAPSTSGTAGSGGDGIDLNLKNGSYSNIEIDHFHFTNVGASDRNGADSIGQKNGGAIVVEARDQGSPYGTVPASFSGAVNIHDGTIDGHTSTGIQAGEPGQTNAGPATTVTNVTITGAQQNALHGDIANETQAIMTFNGTAAGESISSSVSSTGRIVFHGNGGNDTFTGHNELDTATYAATLAITDITYDVAAHQWVVNAGAEGTDRLSGVEKITDGGGHTYILAGNGYATLQAAINASSNGNTILVAAGTLGDTGSVEVNKAVTIAGFYHDVDGNSGTRLAGSESVLNGGLYISVDGVKIDGLKIVGGAVNAGNSNAIYVDHNNVTITHSIIEAGATPADYGIVTPFGGNVSGLSIDGNLVNGWDVGGYFNPSTQFTMTHNTFTNFGNAFDGDDWAPGTFIDGNHFADTTASTVGYGVFDNNENVQNYFGTNTYDGPADRKIGIFAVSALQLDSHAQQIKGTDQFDYMTASDSYVANSNPNDTLEGGAGNDILDGAAGIDTAKYTANISIGNLTQVADADPVNPGSQPGWTVNAGASEGTDLLVNMEIVQGGNGARILLVGSGGFASVQAAVDAAQDNDTILLGTGTFIGNVDIANKALTFVGANHGIGGAAASRGDESIILGRVTATGSKAVVFDGIEFRADGTTGTTTHGNPALGFHGSGEYTVKDSVFYSNFVGGNSETTGIGIDTTVSGAIHIDSNLFTGPVSNTNLFSGASWQRGIYSDGTASHLDITNNTFSNARSAINLDGYDDTTHNVSGNTFAAAGTGISVGIPKGTTYTGIHDNDFLTVNDDFNFQNLTTAVTLDLTATHNGSSGGTAPIGGVMQILGGSVGDTITGSSGADKIFANGGDDTIKQDAGSDTIDGGPGTDTYVLSSAFSAYTITRSGAVYTIQQGADTDTVSNVEKFTFAGGFTADVTNGNDDAIVSSIAPAIQSVVEAGPDEDSNPSTISVVENAAVGTSVATVTVTDANIAAGDVMTYSLVDGSGNPYTGPFSITGSGGTATIKVAGPIDFETTTSFAFQVKVVDSAGHSVIQAVPVFVLNANDAPTDITLSNSSFDEEAPGAIVGALTGVDQDPGSTFTYTVSDSRFVVQHTGGQDVLKLASGQSVNFEAPEHQVALNITATDTGGLSVTKAFTLQVNNVNEATVAPSGPNNVSVESGATAAPLKNSGNAPLDLPTDPDGPLSFTVNLLPADGAVMLNGVALALSQVLSADDMQHLTYTAAITNQASSVSENLQFTYTDGLSPAQPLLIGLSVTPAANTFYAGTSGADHFDGAAGNDVFIIDNPGDVVIERVGGGNDTVSTGISYALGAGQEIENFETYTTFGTAAINLTGNEFNNRIVGNDGANFINGGGGADTMLGFGGNDIFIVDNAGDHVIEGAGGGNDTVSTGVSYALDAGQEIENLETYTTAGTAAINLTGNEFANRIVGNDGANFINGGGGADTMLGLGGNDIFIVDNAGDHVFESIGGGNDTVSTGVSYALDAGSEIENLETYTTAGTAAINLTGNEFNNRIVGNDGANFINGGGGADTMLGLGGNDILIVDNAADHVFESIGGGNDTVSTTVSYALDAGQEIEILETATTAGTAAINLTGNEFANRIVGNSGDNVISGGAGNDTLFGIGGHDTFVFNTALNATTNVDTIADFNVANDTIRLDKGVFTGLAHTGALDAGAFFAGTAAHDADDRIVYNDTTGALSYDVDGNGAAAAVQFATLTAHLSLTNAHFVVV